MESRLKCVLASGACGSFLMFATCDFRSGPSAREAVENAVGPMYTVRATRNPSLFEVRDALGNLKDIVEVLDRFTFASFAQLQVYFLSSDAEPSSERPYQSPATLEQQ